MKLKLIDSFFDMAFFLLLTICLLYSLIGVEKSLASLTTYGSPSYRLIAPVVEETFKFLTLCLSISYGVVFTAIFAIAEFSNFITFSINNNFGDPAFYIMRVICIGVHFITLGCQIFGFRMYYKYKKWLYLLLGYVTAVFIHLEWNVIAGKFVYLNVIYFYDIITTSLGT